MADSRDMRETGLSRRQLEQVIRRAAELSALEGDADERLPVEEVVRIAAEIGLPPHAVQQAVQEVSLADPAPGTRTDRWLERKLGPAAWVSTRRVPQEPERVMRAIEEYLITREYLQLRRRGNNSAWFEPADDTLSAVTRAVTSVSRRYRVATARGVSVSVMPDSTSGSHLHIALDFADKRRSAFRAGLVTGGIFGAVAGAGGFMLVAAGVATVAAGPLSLLAGAGVGMAALAAGAATGVAAAGPRFRRTAHAAQLDVEGLLDRLQRNERLDPPGAPWMRRLRSQVMGQLPSR